MGAWPMALSFLARSLSFLRSVLQPIRMVGVFGQKCLTSGNHWLNKMDKAVLSFFTSDLILCFLIICCSPEWRKVSAQHWAPPVWMGGGGQCPHAGSVVWVNYSLKNAAKANITVSVNHLLHGFRLQLNSSSWAHLQYLSLLMWGVTLYSLTFIRTFSKLVGLVTSKQTRIRLASWYESGRSRS